MGQHAPRLLTATVAAALLFIAQATIADPLHRVAGTHAWRHEFSGWVFPLSVAQFERVGEPWQIDGGDDVGARYVAPGAEGACLEVQVLAGATADLPPEAAALHLPGLKDLRGARFISTSSGPGITARYLVVSRDWSVRITATAGAAISLERLDGAVRALPWETLGGPRLH